MSDRPQDPAGSRPRHDPEGLLPRGDGPLGHDEVERIVEAEGIDDAIERRTELHLADLLPAPAIAGAAPGADTATVVEEDAAEPLPPAPHAARFQFLFGALLAIAAAAVILFALAVRGDESKPAAKAGPAWSTWEPRDGAGATPAQIADHVSGQYVGEDGKQLVYVEGSGMKIEGLPLTVAVREPASAGGRIRVFDDKGVLYRMCGLGKDCAIPVGKPSIQRHLLLRREALELALYTFRYQKDVEQVTVLLPPPPGKTASQAIFFRRPQITPELKKPLDATLSSQTPTVADATRSPDALLVQQLTIPTLFKFNLTQGNQEGRAFLVLDPLATGGAPTGTESGGSSSGSSGSTTSQ